MVIKRQRLFPNSSIAPPKEEKQKKNREKIDQIMSDKSISAKCRLEKNVLNSRGKEHGPILSDICAG